MDSAELLRRKKPRVRVVEVMLDDTDVTERDRLVVEIARVERQESWDGGDMASPLPALKQRLFDIEEQIRSNTAKITFQAVPRTAWQKMIDELCDEDGTITEAFARGIVQASATDPKLSVDEVDQIWDTWSAAETDALYLGAWRVNREVRDIPFTSDGIEQILNTVSKSTTAPNEE